MSGSLTAAPASAQATGTPVYADGLAVGWADWSWGSTVDLVAPAGRSGSRGITVRTDRAWGGLYLSATTALPTGPDSVVELAVRPHSEGARLALVLFGATREPLHAPEVVLDGPPAGTWTTVQVRLADLGVAGQAVAGLSLQDFTGRTGQVADVDDVQVTGTAPSAPTPPPVAAPVEVRPGNAVPNATRGRPTDPSAFFGHEGFRPYYAQVDGNHTGSTEEILRWAADKWGFDDLGVPEISKAMAVAETWWRQEHVGANYGELGILQVNPGAWPDAGPAAWSTAYSADYAMAVVRHHYDGQSWLGAATQGDLRNAIAAWECGCGWNGGGWYTTKVFGYLETKPWLRPGVPPEWF